MYRVLTACLLPLLLVTNLSAQNGPGGVGDVSSNGLWLRADALDQPDGSMVASWTDTSGNGNHALQMDISRQPVYHASTSLNGMPSVRLDGIDDQLVVPDADILDGSTAITYFAVLRPYNLDSEPRGILGKRITYTQEIEYAYDWFFWNNRKIQLDVHTNNNRFLLSSFTFDNGNNYLLSWDFDGSRPSATRSVLYIDDRYRQASNENSTSLPNSNRDLAIGALNEDYGKYLAADYAEIIHFNYALNDVERLLVNNYLAGKYGLPLTSTDLYVQDDVTNGDYDHDIAGIGRKDALTAVTEARGTGLLTIVNPEHLDDDEYFLWGHDGGAMAFTNTTDLPPLTTAMLDRVWRISETNAAGSPVSVGGLDVRIEIPGFDAAEAGKLAIVFDSNNDGSFFDEIPYAGFTHLGEETYELTGVRGHQDGSRMTLALLSYDASPILPVDLLGFQAHLSGNETVLLTWQAENEVDLAYYSVERSADGRHWEPIVSLSPQAVAGEIASYDFQDLRVDAAGILYYRLKMVDTDGSHRYSSVENVFVSAWKHVSLYPNPVIDKFWIKGAAIRVGQLSIYDEMGRSVLGNVDAKQLSSNQLELTAGRLPSGIYYVTVGKERIAFRKN